MKSHERLKAEGFVERYLSEILELHKELIDDRGIYHSEIGDFRIEIRATYLGSKSKKRLTEPLVD